MGYGSSENHDMCDGSSEKHDMDDGNSENHDAPTPCDAECCARLVSLVIFLQCNTFSANHHKISKVSISK